MILCRVIPPAVRYRARFLYANKSGLQQIRGCKNRESALSKSVKSELDTNVKPLSEKVKETTKTGSYLAIILLGVGVTFSLFYTVFNELFSSTSPNNIYSKAVERCKEDPRVRDKLGLPIAAYGAESSRRRRQHVQHVIFERNGKKCIQMNFHLKGSFHQGTAYLEMVENDSGYYEYNYLLVRVQDMLQNVIIVEDNRQKQASSPMTEFS